MPAEANVIIPVYNAKKSLRRCVESILFGAFRDISVILVDDCSLDDSWLLCQQLSEEFDQVKCIRNDINRGVSYSRNRGLELADGNYVLFVDSDDWVSGEYAARLLEVVKQFPDSLPICGLKFMDETSGERRDYLWKRTLKEYSIAAQSEFFELVKKFQLQQIWNKIFRRSIIEEHALRFDETKKMGEDFQFVLDYIEAAGIRECVILNRPLYYYIRTNSNSLMSNFGLVEREDEYNRLRKLHALICEKTENADVQLDAALFATRKNYIYQICKNKHLKKEEKLQNIECIMQDGKAALHYQEQKNRIIKETLLEKKNKISRIPSKIKSRFRILRREIAAARAKKKCKAKEFSIISQNCIGGVLYHDMGMQFLSPTINLFFQWPDFGKFVNDLKYYMNQELNMSWGEEYPIGSLGDIKIYFMHYSSCTEAKETWEKRKARIKWDRIFVIATDKDGFDASCLSLWKTVPYPKILFTVKDWNDKTCVSFPKYQSLACVPDLIPSREFYKDDVLISSLNAYAESFYE